MMYCGKCGTQIEDNVKFCPTCGASTAAGDNDAPVGTVNTASAPTPVQQSDAESGKVQGILAYLGPLVLIPLLTSQNNPFVRFHTNQGLILLIASIIYTVVYSILSGIILAVSWRLYSVVTIIGLVSIVFLVLVIMGIINVTKGEMKELPVIGKIKILK